MYYETTFGVTTRHDRFSTTPKQGMNLIIHAVHFSSERDIKTLKDHFLMDTKYTNNH